MKILLSILLMSVLLASKSPIMIDLESVPLAGIKALNRIPKFTSKMTKLSDYTAVEGTKARAGVRSRPISYRFLEFNLYQKEKSLLINKRSFNKFFMPFQFDRSTYISSQKNGETEPNFSLKSKNTKKAKKLAWLYPGLGHFYIGNESRGWQFFILETIYLHGTFTMITLLNGYSESVDKVTQEYLAAKDEDEIHNQYSRLEVFLEKKNQTKMRLAAAGGISLGIWIWNIIDIKKRTRDEINLQDKIDLELDETGQIKIRFAF